MAPRAGTEAVRQACARWAAAGVRGWDEWLDLPRRLGDRLATPILGARPGEVVLSDSTSVNLYKLALAARAARPGRPVIVASGADFPTDRYILEGLGTCRWVTSDPVFGPSVEAVTEALDEDTAVVCLSHVDYRSSAVADMPGIGHFLVGTPPVLALAAVEAALEVVVEAGLTAIRAKGLALGSLAVQLGSPLRTVAPTDK